MWSHGSAVELVRAVEPFHMYGDKPDKDLTRARVIQEGAKASLREAGLKVLTFIGEGNPKSLLVKEARKFDADCIFVGARGHTFFERFLLGSVSAAVAARTHCSVAVTRSVKD